MHIAGQPLALHRGTAVAAERFDLGLRRGEFAHQARALLTVFDDAGHPEAERDGEREPETCDRGGDGQSGQHRIRAVEDAREHGETHECADSDNGRSDDCPASVHRQHPGQRVGDRLQDREEGLARAPARQRHRGAGDEDRQVPRPRRGQCGPCHEQIAQCEQHERAPGDDGVGRRCAARSDGQGHDDHEGRGEHRRVPPSSILHGLVLGSGYASRLFQRKVTRASTSPTTSQIVNAIATPAMFHSPFCSSAEYSSGRKT